jgi:SLT domain-containing protein
VKLLPLPSSMGPDAHGPSPAEGPSLQFMNNRYGDGGINTQPTWGTLGEDGPEVVLPPSKPQRAQQLAEQAGIGGTTEVKNLNPNVYTTNSPIDIRESFRRMELLEGV